MNEKNFSEVEDLGILTSQARDLRKEVINQETQALEAIVERIKPLIPLAAHEIVVGSHKAGYQFARAEERLHDQKGLIVVDHFIRENVDRLGGTFSGERAVLFKGGSFVLQKREGEWSNLEGESSRWAMIEEKDVPPRALIMKFGLDQVLTGLFDELQGARESLKLDIEALQKRLEEVEKIRKAIEEA